MISRQFRGKRQELETTRGRLEQVRPIYKSTNSSAEAQAGQAMELFDQIELLAADPEARAPCGRC